MQIDVQFGIAENVILTSHQGKSIQIIAKISLNKDLRFYYYE